jgi:hypothetical protein
MKMYVCACFKIYGYTMVKNCGVLRNFVGGGGGGRLTNSVENSGQNGDPGAVAP